MNANHIDKHVSRVAVSIYRAVSIPQILPYLRKQLIRNICNNLDTLTDQEIEADMINLRKLLNDAKETRQI